MNGEWRGREGESVWGREGVRDREIGGEREREGRREGRKEGVS